MKGKTTNNTYSKKGMGLCGIKAKTCPGSYIVHYGGSKDLAEKCKKCPVLKK